jgi:hypothetical protein
MALPREMKADGARCPWCVFGILSSKNSLVKENEKLRKELGQPAVPARMETE